MQRSDEILKDLRDYSERTWSLGLIKTMYCPVPEQRNHTGEKRVRKEWDFLQKAQFQLASWGGFFAGSWEWVLWGRDNIVTEMGKCDISLVLMLKSLQTGLWNNSLRVYCSRELPAGAGLVYLCQNTRRHWNRQPKAVSDPNAKEWLPTRTGGAGIAGAVQKSTFHSTELPVLGSPGLARNPHGLQCLWSFKHFPHLGFLVHFYWILNMKTSPLSSLTFFLCKSWNPSGLRNTTPLNWWCLFHVSTCKLCKWVMMPQNEVQHSYDWLNLISNGLPYDSLST